MPKKPHATIMVEPLSGDLIVTNGETYNQKRVNPEEFADSHHNHFHSSQDCVRALLKLVGANIDNFKLSITPLASRMISQIYMDSNKLS